MSSQQNLTFSVIMPSYNQGSYIGRAITSVLNQSFSNFEIIIVDNHSTDNTLKVISKFNDKRLKLIKINNDGVIAKSRNAGVQLARGNWIAFLDTDDWWTEEKLMKCSKVIEGHVDLIFHDLKIFPHKFWSLKKKIIEGRKLNTPVLFDLLKYGNVIPNSSVVVRKSFLNAIGGISEDENLIAAEDYHTWLQIAQLTNQFFYLPEKLGFYTNHIHGTSRKNMSVPGWFAIKDFLYTLSDLETNTAKANLKYSSGRFNYLNGNINLAKSEFIFTLKHGLFPLKFKSFIMLILISLKKLFLRYGFVE